MNAQIIELLNFALQNSGLDIDEILQMVAAQRKEMSDLRKQVEQGGLLTSAGKNDARVKQGEGGDDASAITDLRRRIAGLREAQDIDFLLYYNKVIQLGQLARAALNTDAASPELHQMARELNNLSNAEAALLKRRREEAALRVGLTASAFELDSEFEAASIEDIAYLEGVRDLQRARERMRQKRAAQKSDEPKKAASKKDSAA